MTPAANESPKNQREKSAFMARDPRFLMAGFALIAVSAFAVPRTWGLAVVLAYTLLLHRASGLSAASLARTCIRTAPFIALILVVNALLVEGEPVVPALAFVSREGITSGIHAGVRVLVLVLGGVVFFAVAPPEEIAKGVAALVSPFSRDLSRRFAMYAFLSAGFLPLFADETRRITVAQRFRGGGFEGGFVQRLRGARLLVVPLILSAVHRSAGLAAAVEIRRIRSTIAGILVLEKTGWNDYVFLAGTAAVVAAAWIAA
jgi:energy-coupling factor transporter transmembrane protein EcfT